MYEITKYSKDQARKLNVVVYPSSCKNKKIDVFTKDGIKICSIGDITYKDYPTYLKENKSVAEERRRLYKLRHRKDLSVAGSAGWYADRILW
jgi:hypothetical protein